MSGKMKKAYEESVEAQERLRAFVEEIAWKKGKSDEDTYHEALCNGILALCKQQDIIMELLRRQVAPAARKPLPIVPAVAGMDALVPEPAAPAEPVEEEAPVPAEQPSASAEDDPFAWAEDTPDLTEEDLAVADQPADPAEEVAPPPDPPTPSVLGFTMTTIDGRAQPLSAYQGKVMLIVNTASRCGLTGQYEGLQALHTEFADDGLAVLGFPANNFQGQEPGSNQDIATFCRANYGVTFRMFAKISVAGPDRHALYNTLTAAHTEPTGPGPISWNFEKFLIARDGTVVARFAPQVPPRHATIVEAIQRELAR